MGLERLMANLRGRGSFAGRVQRCTQRRVHPLGSSRPSNTVRWREFERRSKTRERSADRHLVLNCFQEGLTEVTNAHHLEGTTIEEDQKRSRGTGPEVTSPKTSSRVAVAAQDHVKV